MRKMFMLALAASVYLVGQSNAHDEARLALARCKDACGDFPGEAIATLVREEGCWQATDLKCMYAYDVSMTDASLASLGDLTSLHGLTIRFYRGGGEGSRLTPMGYRSIANLHLRRLHFLSRVSTDGLKIISSMAGLEDLCLREVGNETRLDHVLASYEGLRNLRRLDLHDPALINPTLEGIKGLEKLEHLWLPLHNITDAGMLSLERLTNLQSLRLVHLREKDVAVLKRLPRLESLRIGAYEPSSGDADLSELRGLKKLWIEEVESDADLRIHLPENLHSLVIGDIWLKNDVVDKLDIPSAKHLARVCFHLPYNKQQRKGVVDLSWLHSIPELTTIELRNATDTDVTQLAGLTSVREILLAGPCLPGERFGDKGMKAIAGLQQIESFETNWFGSVMTDEGLDVLHRLPHLRRLVLRHCPKLTARGFAMLTDMKQLRILTLEDYGESSTDDVLAFIAGLTNLEELSIESSTSGPLTDVGLKYVAALKKLRHLELTGRANCTDDGLANLMNELPNLTSLTMTVCPRGKNP